MEKLPGIRGELLRLELFAVFGASGRGPAFPFSPYLASYFLIRSMKKSTAEATLSVSMYSSTT